MIVELARLLLFPSLIAFAATSDLLTMTISNRISLALVAGFLLLALACGLSPHSILAHAAAGLLVLAVGLTLFARGLVGGGDAKLAAAVALWLGFGRLFDFALVGALLGGVLTLGILVFRFMPLPPWLARHNWALRMHEYGAGVPYGIALSAAALLIYPSTIWMPA
jgi:prepilin peptidase CpaA